MAHSLKIAKVNSITNQVIDYTNGPERVDGSYVGMTGGHVPFTIRTGTLQFAVKMNIPGRGVDDGYILAQKGKHEHLLTNTTYTYHGTCRLSNVTPLSVQPGQMNLTIITNLIQSASIASANVAGGATSTYVTFDPTSPNVTGPIPIAVGDYIPRFAGNASAARIVSINSPGNVTVSVAGNVAAQSGIQSYSVRFASRISSKFVWDFGTDGSPLSTQGNVTYYTSGYNPNRFRYHSASPTSTFVSVAKVAF
jgi:hypothetical protein